MAGGILILIDLHLQQQGQIHPCHNIDARDIGIAHKLVVDAAPEQVGHDDQVFVRLFALDQPPDTLLDVIFPVAIGAESLKVFLLAHDQLQRIQNAGGKVPVGRDDKTLHAMGDRRVLPACSTLS